MNDMQWQNDGHRRNLVPFSWIIGNSFLWFKNAPRGCAACGVRKYHGCSRTTLFVCGQRVCWCGECVATHVCRGNFHSTYASSGAYDAVAEVLFGEENAAGYYLEFDDERSGGFASCESGNKLTEEQQWAKLKLVKEIAEEVWERKGKSSLLV